MTAFIPGGPRRYSHQKRGLRKIIDNRGIGALLFDPGTGKTAVALDYASILALKSPTKEARVLVVCPLAACDTWVTQAMEYTAPGINVWAEVLGGSLLHRAEALANRGGRSFRKPLNERTARSRQYQETGPRARHATQSWAWKARAPLSISINQGPDALGDSDPRLILEVLNFDTFSSRKQHGSRTTADIMIRAIDNFEPDLVIVDESHKIKGASSNVSMLMRRIGTHVSHRLILTGTVMPHSPLDVFGQWRFLDPTAFGVINEYGVRQDSTFASFRSRYAKMGGYMGREVKSFKNLDEMQEIMQRKASVARKSDVLDLPATTDVTVPVHLAKREQDAYREMKKQLVVTLSQEKVAAASRLTQMMRLRQITSGMIPNKTGDKEILGTSKVDTIVSLVQDTLAGEKRIVIFCQFTKEIEQLRSVLVKRKAGEVPVIQGGVSNEDRQAIRKRFGSDAPERMILIAQIKTLSLAVNELVTANHAIFGSLSQQRDDFIQARDRLNRVGQTRPVTYWYALVPGTVDEVIFNSIQRRTDLERAMLDHILDDRAPSSLSTPPESVGGTTTLGTTENR